MEKLKEKDIITEIMEDLGREIPSAKEVLVDERDRYIANRILNLEARKVLVVVGAGHVEGIKKIIESNSKSRKELNNEIDELEGIPQKKSRIK
ncbi:MAG: TraB/GumN family protein, partial [Candidatus Altiarchaeota archaeon]|nr:TraB/GumN family protein [Candidatus Altiarchaeota archaeon]